MSNTNPSSPPSRSPSPSSAPVADPASSPPIFTDSASLPVKKPSRGQLNEQISSQDLENLDSAVDAVDANCKEDERKLRHRTAQRKYKKRLVERQQQLVSDAETAATKLNNANEELDRKNALINEMRAVMMVQNEEIDALRSKLHAQTKTSADLKQQLTDLESLSELNNEFVKNEEIRSQAVSKDSFSVDDHDDLNFNSLARPIPVHMPRPNPRAQLLAHSLNNLGQRNTYNDYSGDNNFGREMGNDNYQRRTAESSDAIQTDESGYSRSPSANEGNEVTSSNRSSVASDYSSYSSNGNDRRRNEFSEAQIDDQDKIPASFQNQHNRFYQKDAPLLHSNSNGSSSSNSNVTGISSAIKSFMGDNILDHHDHLMRINENSIEEDTEMNVDRLQRQDFNSNRQDKGNRERLATTQSLRGIEQKDKNASASKRSSRERLYKSSGIEDLDRVRKRNRSPLLRGKVSKHPKTARQSSSQRHSKRRDKYNTREAEMILLGAGATRTGRSDSFDLEESAGYDKKPLLYRHAHTDQAGNSRTSFYSTTPTATTRKTTSTSTSTNTNTGAGIDSRSRSTSFKKSKGNGTSSARGMGLGGLPPRFKMPESSFYSRQENKNLLSVNEENAILAEEQAKLNDSVPEIAQEPADLAARMFSRENLNHSDSLQALQDLLGTNSFDEAYAPIRTNAEGVNQSAKINSFAETNERVKQMGVNNPLITAQNRRNILGNEFRDGDQFHANYLSPADLSINSSASRRNFPEPLTTRGAIAKANAGVSNFKNQGTANISNVHDGNREREDVDGDAPDSWNRSYLNYGNYNTTGMLSNMANYLRDNASEYSVFYKDSDSSRMNFAPPGPYRAVRDRLQGAVDKFSHLKIDKSDSKSEPEAEAKSVSLFKQINSSEEQASLDQEKHHPFYRTRRISSDDGEKNDEKPDSSKAEKSNDNGTTDSSTIHHHESISEKAISHASSLLRGLTNHPREK